MSLIIIGLIGLLGWIVFRTLAGPADYAKFDGRIYGTHYRITYLKGPDVATVQAAVMDELDRIDQMASNWIDDSEIMRYQRSPDRENFPLSQELATLLDRAEQIKTQTGGAFDVAYKPGEIDLSAIAKGYAVDRITDLLTEDFAIASCMVDIGGEIKVRGPSPRGDHWAIGVYAATEEKDFRLPEVHLRDSSIATSGTSFHGKPLIDPASGRTAESALVSVSVIHPSNTTADALATALFVMGPEKGLSWAQKHGVQAKFVLADGRILQP